MKLLSITILALAMCHAAHAQETVQVKVRVDSQSNTLYWKEGNQRNDFTWWGVECPHIDQTYGQEVLKFLRKHIHNKVVTLSIQNQNRKGIPMVILTHADGQVVNELLLKKGMAWAVERSLHTPYLEMQEKAMEAQIGLWQDEEPMSPWAYRRKISQMEAKGR
jgi:micrococcal nuclease